MWRITLRELKDKKWSLLVYCLGSLALLWMYAATFRSSQSSTQQLQDLVKTYPKGLLDALGLNNLSLDTVEIYLNAKHFSLLWPLLAIILAMSRAGSSIAGEIQSGTMGLLLASPVKRWQLFTAKYLFGLLTIMLFTFVSVFGIVPLAAAYSIPTHLHILASTWVLVTLFMWAIYTFCLAISSWAREKGTVYAISGGTLIVLYAAYILSLIIDKLHWLKYVSPFYYLNTQQALSTGHIGLSSVFVFGAVIALSSLVALWRFCTRDISV